MYLSEVLAENFRIFGESCDDPKEDRALLLDLHPGLNVLVGENDSGKTAAIDAIRYTLWTTSLDYHRLSEDDFHCTSTGRAKELMIRCKFAGLSDDDVISLLEWLTTPAGQEPVLYVTLRARLLDIGKGRRRIPVTVHAGQDGEGPALEGTVRELIRSTYLRPLRDAESELRPGRNSRLSQILAGHPQITAEEADDFDPKTDKASTLVGIMRRAEHHARKNKAVKSAGDAINDEYLSRLSIADEALLGEIKMSGSTLKEILEKLELRLAAPSQCAEWTRRGLGFNNALFMATELLLLGAGDACPTLLIEEPEAHLHPQLQARVMDLLREKSEPNAGTSVQVILTTHSPNLASSVSLKHVVYMCEGKAYSLAPDKTKLAEGDYAFLERFLDVTKANLFFARAVLIVEGDAENLLLPALAKSVGRSLSELGVSIVNVGHTGLFRYGSIFQRRDGQALPVRVACLSDRDVLPDELPDDLKGSQKRESELDEVAKRAIITAAQKRDGGSVRTFVSNYWTFEFDLARSSWKMAALMHQAISCTEASPSDPLEEERLTEIRAQASACIKEWRTQGKTLADAALEIYLPLTTKRRKRAVSKAIAAQYAAQFLEGITLSAEDLPSYLNDALDYVTSGSGGATCGV